MRVLVAGRHAKLLAQAARACARDLNIETVETKAAALSLLGETVFDLIIACERLRDGCGLEVLSHVAVNTPDTLRVFAARPGTLENLKGELGLFGLFRTLEYPIELRALWAVISLARGCLEPNAAAPMGEPVTQVRHVVLESEWDSTGEWKVSLADLEPVPLEDEEAQELGAESSGKPAVEVLPPPQAAGTTPPAHPVARIPESDAFKRARARREAEKQRRDSPPPPVARESLAQLARRTLERAPVHVNVLEGVRKRTLLMVGSGLCAAAAVAVVSFFVLNPNRSVGQAPEIVAQSPPETLFPSYASAAEAQAQIQPVPTPEVPPSMQVQQPTRLSAQVIQPPPPVPSAVASEALSPTAAELQAQTEQEEATYRTQMEMQHRYRQPPPTNYIPGPSEPPSLENPVPVTQ